MKVLLAVLILAIGFSTFGKSQSGNKTLIALSKIIQKQAKEIAALKAEISTLKQGESKKAKPKKLSRFAARLAIKDLERKIAALSNKIKSYSYKSRNPQVYGSLRTEDNIKGWCYKKAPKSVKKDSDFFDTETGEGPVQPASTIPKRYNRKGIKIIYYTRVGKKTRLKKKYLAKVVKLEKEKEALVKELEKIK